MSSGFRYLLRVRYSECDAQKVVFNPRFGEYVDTAMTEYMRQLLGGYEQLLEMGVDQQVVKLTTEWASSARFDEVLALTIETAHIGNTSYSLRIGFEEYFSGRAVATSEIVYVVVDAERFEKIRIPDAVREKLQAGAPGIVVDHAGVINAS